MKTSATLPKTLTIRRPIYDMYAGVRGLESLDASVTMTAEKVTVAFTRLDLMEGSNPVTIPDIEVRTSDIRSVLLLRGSTFLKINLKRPRNGKSAVKIYGFSDDLVKLAESLRNAYPLIPVTHRKANLWELLVQTWSWRTGDHVID